MTVSEKNSEKLKELELMMGRHRGRLALAIDLLTEAVVSVHQSGGQSKELIERLNEARQLIQTVLHELKGKK